MVTAIREMPVEIVSTMFTEEYIETKRGINTSQTYSLAEFMALPDNDKQYELVKGRLVEMPGPSIGHATIISALNEYLNAFVRNQRLGLVSSNAAFVFDPLNDPNSARRPGISFVNKSRLVGVDYNDAFAFPPDLAVEVVSRTDVWYEVSSKTVEYKEAGVPLVWVIFPPEQQVFVYSQHEKVKMLLADDELEGGEVIPGFKLKVSALFDWESMLEQQPEAK